MKFFCWFMLLRQLDRRGVASATHHERKCAKNIIFLYIYMCVCVCVCVARTSSVTDWSPLLLLSTAWSFAHLPLGLSDHNKMVLWPGCAGDARCDLHEKDVRWEQHVLNVPRAINNRVCARRASSIVTCCHSVKLCVHDLRFTTKHWLARHTHSLMVVYSVVVCTRFAINILKHHWCWTSLLLFKSRPYWPRNRLGKRKKKVSPRCPRWSSAHLMNVISRWAFSYPLRLGNCVITKAWTDLCIVTVNYSRLGGLKRVFQKPSIH